ncbi:MAG: methionine gamma-lyase family protein [Oscillospiraceae bacterium]|jgi:cystathionine beta-lyase family protein involved in aluminum resistance|nr:methionine gamma-lyase family protein [Oscillospiraceae bacterium]
MSMFDFSPKLLSFAEEAEEMCGWRFAEIDKITEYNQQRVLSAFIENGVSARHLHGSTGYGYGDEGRDLLDKVFALSIGAQDALVRHTFASGTHALAVMLSGVLRPGDRLLSVTGQPYDTLIGVLGHKSHTPGSLTEQGVTYDEVPLGENGQPDIQAIRNSLSQNPATAVYIQRSRGYSLRPSITSDCLVDLINGLRETAPGSIILCDNCYCEFTECQTSFEAGIDLSAGSLIKNPGGGLVRTGGYIAGKADLVERCAARMTAPGVGREVGAGLDMNRELYMGLFNAPHAVGEAMKTAVFAAALFELMGYKVFPLYSESRPDIVQSVLLGHEENLIKFCQGLQSGSPVDSSALPLPWDMPGYDNQVIMAAGTFTLGASIELSSDAPLREPYAVWLQGALNYHSGKIGVLSGAAKLM